MYDLESDCGVVLGCGCKVGGCHIGLVCAYIRALRSCFCIILCQFLCDRDRAVICAVTIAVDALFCPVVDLRIALSGYRDYIFLFIRGDLKRSRYYCDLDVRVVFGCRTEVSLTHRHCVGAHIGSLCGSLCVILLYAAECDRRIVFAHCVAVDALLCPVIDLRIALSGYCDLILICDRGDLKRSRYYRDLDVRVVLRCRTEVILTHCHCVGAHIGSLCGSLCVILLYAAECDRRIVFAHCVAVDALLCPVIDLRIALSGYCDLILICDRGDLKRSRYYRDLDVRVVLRCRTEVILTHRHRVGANIGSRSYSFRISLCYTSKYN